MEAFEIVFALIVCALSYVAYKLYQLQTYWKSRGVPYVQPKFMVGNMTETAKKPYFMHYREVYEKLKGKSPFVGFYFFLMPFAFITDLELVKSILIKDFNNFVDRGMYTNEKDDPLTGHLFSVDGDRWRVMRHKLSTTFTSGKMKFMFPTVSEVSKQLSAVLSSTVEKSDSIVEIKELLSKYTTDVIGRCAFGIDCNSLKNPNAEFRLRGKQIFSDHRHNAFIEAMMFTFPNFFRKIGVKFTPQHVSDFFLGAVRETVAFREKNNVVKNDFMNILMELKKNKETSLTIEEIAAQCFLFFAAGFETSSSTMGFCLYELALNQDIQEKARTEILEIFEKHKGELTYESMKEMRYLEQCVKETLRKYAILPHLQRVALKDYKIENFDLTIEKGTVCMIPIDSIMNDCDIYPNPETFNPDRFSQEEIQNRHPMAWLPFGDGPRNCVGLRFGKMQTYIGLIDLLSKFQFSVCGRTAMPLEFETGNIFFSTKSGIYLKVENVK
ncbi:hypothetical protein ACFFRR_010124 [Megaselia abdita]